MTTIIGLIIAGVLMAISGFCLCASSLFYMMDEAPVAGEGWSIAAVISSGILVFCCGCYMVIVELGKIFK